MKIASENRCPSPSDSRSVRARSRNRKSLRRSSGSVVLADWNEKEVQAVAKDLTNKGLRTLAATCDVSDDAQVEAMMKQTVTTFGRLNAA